MQLACAYAQARAYPPLRKGRLGGDDCTQRLPAYCQKIINTLPKHHPLLRLPFPRGGYQLAFQLVFNHQFLPTSNPTAAAKIRCYAVFKNKQLSSRRLVTAFPPLRKRRLGGDEEACPNPPRGREHCYGAFLQFLFPLIKHRVAVLPHFCLRQALYVLPQCFYRNAVLGALTQRVGHQEHVL